MSTCSTGIEAFLLCRDTRKQEDRRRGMASVDSSFVHRTLQSAAVCRCSRLVSSTVAHAAASLLAKLPFERLVLIRIRMLSIAASALTPCLPTIRPGRQAICVHACVFQPRGTPLLRQGAASLASSGVITKRLGRAAGEVLKRASRGEHLPAEMQAGLAGAIARERGGFERSDRQG